MSYYGNRKKYHKRKKTPEKNIRDNHFQILQSIRPGIELNQHSTFGKYLIETTRPFVNRLSDLQKKQRQKHAEIKQLNFKISRLIKDNEAEFENRKKRELDKQLEAIIINKHKLTYFFHKYIGVLGAFSFFIYTYFTQFSMVLLGSHILFFSILSYSLKIRKKRHYNLYINQVNRNLEKTITINNISNITNNYYSQITQIEKDISSIQCEINDVKYEIQFILLFFEEEEKTKFILSDQFYTSTDWKLVRNKALKALPNICVKCKSTSDLSVDHIKPRSKYPHLALEISNTQILCRSCNSSKGAKIKF